MYFNPLDPKFVPGLSSDCPDEGRPGVLLLLELKLFISRELFGVGGVKKDLDLLLFVKRLLIFFKIPLSFVLRAFSSTELPRLLEGFKYLLVSLTRVSDI